LYPELDMRRVPEIIGIPRFAIRQGLQQACRWTRTRFTGDSLGALVEELRLIQYGGLFVQCWLQPRTGAHLSEERTRYGVGLAGDPGGS
jgi:hypothetical protein